MKTEQYNIIQALQKNYNILVVFHTTEPEYKRVFVVKSFIPIQPSYTFLDLRGQEITDLITDNTFWGQFSLGRQVGISNMEFQETQFSTKLQEIPIQHLQFSPDYSWEWYLNS